MYLFLIRMIGVSFGCVQTAEVEKTLPESKKGKAARAVQACHQEQWVLLSLKTKPNGDKVYTVYDPGFGYKKITRTANKNIDSAWLS